MTLSMAERSLSEDITAGACCAFCTSYFVTKIRGQETGPYEHGYPVACWDCWEEDCGYKKATADTD
jgi:hypothetical protein